MGEGRESRDGRKGHGREDDHLLQEPPFVHFCGALAAAKFLLADTHCTISSKTTTVVVDEDILARALRDLNLASRIYVTTRARIGRDNSFAGRAVLAVLPTGYG